MSAEQLAPAESFSRLLCGEVSVSCFRCTFCSGSEHIGGIVFVAMCSLMHRVQAVAEAIVKGNCLNSEAISEVLAEVGGTFTAESTCGLTATAIQVEPDYDYDD